MLSLSPSNCISKEARGLGLWSLHQGILRRGALVMGSNLYHSARLSLAYQARLAECVQINMAFSILVQHL